jgi:hypothetical protein
MTPLGQEDSSVKKIHDISNGRTILITEEKIRNLYSELRLTSQVLKALLQAHEDVIKHGISTINYERVIVLDKATGSKVVDTVGTRPYEVIWELPQACYNSELITIHNHPTSSPFSPLDLYSFGIRK